MEKKKVELIKGKEEIIASLRLAESWLKKHQKENGAFHGDFIWHDGEAIRALLSIYRRTGEKALLEKAKRCGDFILSLQYLDKKNKRYYGCYETPAYTSKKQIAPSDIHELIPGMLELYETTKEEKYLNSAALAADWLIKNATYKRKGVMGQVFDAEKWEVINPLPVHDEAGFLKLWELTGKEEYLEVFNDQIDYLCEYQNLNGQWLIFHYTQQLPVFQIPFVSAGRSIYWYTYSLIAYYKKFKNRWILPKVIRSCDWLLRIQLWNGVIPAFISTDFSSFSFVNKIHESLPSLDFNIDGTATAMAVVLWIGMYKEIPDKSYLFGIERAIRWIIDNQIKEGENKGAYFHGYRFDRNGFKWKLYLRDISTFYGVMALEEYLNFINNKKVRQNELQF